MLSPLLAALAGCSFLTKSTAADPLTYDIPRLSGITIDGSGADWNERGLLISPLAPADGNMPAVTDCDAKVRLGWNENGLLVLAHVVDKADNEDPDETSLYRADSVELYLARSRNAGSENVQWIVGPGFDNDRPGLRCHFYDHRLKQSPATAIVKSSKTADGYLVEALLPWSTILTGPPKAGTTAAFQIDVNDRDGDSRRQLLWYPAPDAYRLDTSMNSIRLVDGPPAPRAVPGLALAGKVHYGKIDVDVIAGSSMVGHTVSLVDNGREVASAKLIEDNGRARQKMSVPVPTSGLTGSTVTITIDGSAFQRLQLPNYMAARADRIDAEGLTLSQYIFSDSTFPVIDFSNPGDAADILGDYHIKTRFFDPFMKEVRSPDKPGRYGVAIEISDAGGLKWRRYRSIYKTPTAIDWAGELPKSPVKLAEAMGVDRAVAEANASSINDAVGQIHDGNYQQSGDVATVIGVLQSLPSTSGAVDVWKSADVLAWELKKSAGDTAYP